MLTHHMLTNGMTPIDAARETVSKLEGAFALCFLFQGEEDLLIVARKGSPLAIGYGDNEMFVGSDAIALAPMTNRITYLDEGDFAVLTRNSVQIWDAQGALANREVAQSVVRRAAMTKMAINISWPRKFMNNPA